MSKKPLSKKAEKKGAGFRAANRLVQQKTAMLQKLIANKQASKKQAGKKKPQPVVSTTPRFIPKTQLIPVTRTVNFHVITLFPESFTSYISESIIARAQAEGRITISFYDPRKFVQATGAQIKNEQPYLRVDDKPYGGGPGMVMQAEPVIKAIDAAISKAKNKTNVKVLFMSPGGKQFTNDMAMDFVKGEEGDSSTITDFVIICGRYEGVDERVNTIFNSEPITVGPFVLTGGELPAMILIDAMSRHIPGVLGNFDSREESRAASHAVYTRPESFTYKGKEYKVPDVLLSGDHKKIEEWRAEEK